MQFFKIAFLATISVVSAIAIPEPQGGGGCSASQYQSCSDNLFALSPDASVYSAEHLASQLFALVPDATAASSYRTTRAHDYATIRMHFAMDCEARNSVGKGNETLARYLPELRVSPRALLLRRRLIPLLSTSPYLIRGPQGPSTAF
ncbi:hypothetical protein MBM_00534 [Drepanopeziza brunnea f. sp. 'multigermtubi' MB_m1]|uniref:Uncharacterized protein n=1 Tax=Marssonina brunnea f. sp. multigermtubi (strain MB_m1) TaxID=1072389 RepID=K1X8K7_MARBU|nr:uncharacterized protein MBM_00534 [Drepanopeziza brunnea f. sp. 'multigermtubi' MB_m1]EKD21421.1 hypothetical protein MBM_00534 [Drepanopeziza brunnea f. sp. 'multigermtubi' MB_m1]